MSFGETMLCGIQDASCESSGFDLSLPTLHFYTKHKVLPRIRMPPVSRERLSLRSGDDGALGGALG